MLLQYYNNIRYCFYYLLIAESHLPPGVSGNVHPAQEHALASLVFGGCLTPGQFSLNGLMVLFVDHVVHAVAVYEEILLRERMNDNIIIDDINEKY